MSPHPTADRPQWRTWDDIANIFDVTSDVDWPSDLDRVDGETCDPDGAAYGAHPIDEPDEWGDLASFRDAAEQS